MESSSSETPTTETSSPVQEGNPAQDAAPLADAPVVKTAAEGAVAAPVTAPAKTEAPEDNRLAKGFAALSRKEKALRQKEQALKAAEEQLKKIETLREKARTNPLDVLNEYGLTYEQLTDYILGEGAAKPEPTPEDRVAALEARLEAEARDREAARIAESNEAAERKIAAYKEHTLKAGLRAQADKYELINARGDDGAELVFEVIEQYHSQHNTILPWDKAADYVEEHLEAEARKLLGLKKFKAAQSNAQSAQSSEKTTEASETPSLYDNTATLSRSVGGEMPVISDDALPLDPDERNRAVLAKFRLWG